MLTGFSQFSPADGVPAADSTEVLVWYSPSAIHFGIRAYEAHGAVHATLADRDRIGADDHVQILLSTFNDGRQATVFAVNPLGVQSDGALVETGSTSGNGFNNAVVRREVADLSPDYIYQSKGRVTEYGYEVEVRIPFKSLRYQSAAEQSWGINVTRQVQHSGLRGLLGAGAPGERLVPGPVGAAGRAHRSAARPGARSQSLRHLEDHGAAERVGMGLQRRAAPSWAAPRGGGSPTT